MLARGIFAKGIGSLGLTATVLCQPLIIGCGEDDDEDEESGDNFSLTGGGSGSSLATPSSATLSIFQFAASKNTDCSDAKVVIDNGDTAKEFDMLTSPAMGSGTLADGTYPCVVMVMESAISVVASQDDGECESGKTYTQNVCSGGETDVTTTDLAGTKQTCGNNTDRAYVYISTASTADDDCVGEEEGDCSSFEPPTATNTNRGVPLGAALVVNGDETGTFTLSNLNMRNYEDEEGSECGMERPTFTFTSKDG